MREWSADVTVDEPIVRRLIGGQFPAVELASLRLLAEGWDNAVWLADERWAFRFPAAHHGRGGDRARAARAPAAGPSAAGAGWAERRPARLWSFFLAEGRAAFLAAYGPVSEAQPLRARLGRRSLRHPCGYGHEEGLRGVEREALEGPDRCLS